jgi:hypothetical protein
LIGISELNEPKPYIAVILHEVSAGSSSLITPFVVLKLNAPPLGNAPV